MNVRPKCSFDSFLTTKGQILALQEQREYLVDTGASFHCIGESALTDKERDTIREINRPVMLQTAKGITTADQVVDVYVRQLEIFVEALVLGESPPLLSVGQLIKEHSCTSNMGKKGATMKTPSGSPVRVRLPFSHYTMFAPASIWDV